MEECGICGEGLDTKYSLEISCGHKYHYRCIFDDFKKFEENLSVHIVLKIAKGYHM